MSANTRFFVWQPSRSRWAVVGLLLIFTTSVYAVEPHPQQHTLAVGNVEPPSCAIGTLGYLDRDASITMEVGDGSECTGTYTVSISPVSGSAPDDSTPAVTTIVSYIGFSEGSFFFGGAEAGTYRVEAEITAGCSAPRPIVVEEVEVPEGATGGACDTIPPNGYVGSLVNKEPPTCSIFSPGYDDDGSFTVNAEDGDSCSGTYTVNSSPVSESGPGGTTPPNTTIVTYIGFPEGDFFFGNAGPGTYDVEFDDTSGNCGQGVDPFPLEVTIEDGATGGACETLNEDGFAAEVSALTAPTCALASPGFETDAEFTISVEDGASCSGTYTVNASPIPGTAPDGSDPDNTTIVTYIGFSEGDFQFANATPGSYEITVTASAGCSAGLNPKVFTVDVPDGSTGGSCDTLNPDSFLATVDAQMSPTCSVSSPGYALDGSFTIGIEDGASCSGTYTVNAEPVAGSAPDGSTPPFTTVVTYIGFPEGSFFFGNAGSGDYLVTAEASGDCLSGQNPKPVLVSLADGATGGQCDIPNPNQFQTEVVSVSGSDCPFLSPGYDRSGQFTVGVSDGAACDGTYTVNAEPVPGSAPDGTTPPFTTVVTYIGFPEGDFFFNNAGTGEYEVTVTDTDGSCTDVSDTDVFSVTIPDVEAQHTANAFDIMPSSAMSDGSFTIQVDENTPNCPGAYTIEPVPVPGTGYPDPNPPLPTPASYQDVPVGQYTFSDAGIGTYQVLVTETSGLMPDVNPVEIEVEVPPIPKANFEVEKVFTDGNPGEVEVTISCNTGLPLQQTTSISEGSGVSFVVTDFENGEMDCEITESGAEGYNPSYFDGTSSNETSCAYQDVEGARTFTCVITNTPAPVTVEVEKLWIFEGDGFPQSVDMRYTLTLFCDTTIVGGTPLDAAQGSTEGVLDPACKAAALAQGGDAPDTEVANWCLVFRGNGPEVFEAEVIPDYPSSSCHVVESLEDPTVEVENGCEDLTVSAGKGAQCTVTNTVFFEGIPTLSPRMLAILALFMLGTGLVFVSRRV